MMGLTGKGHGHMGTFSRGFLFRLSTTWIGYKPISPAGTAAWSIPTASSGLFGSTPAFGFLFSVRGNSMNGSIDAA